MARNLTPGSEFIKAVMCLAKCDGLPVMAKRLSDRHFGEYSDVSAYLEKAAVPAAHTTDTGGWAEDIAEPVGRAFVGVVDQVSVFGRLGLTPAPLNTRLVGIGTGATAYWRGQGKPAPVTQMAMNGGAFEPLVVSALGAISKEVIKVGDPQAEGFIRAELLRAMRQALDEALIDPANAGTANVKPASLLNGVTPITATATIENDLKALIDDFPGDLESAYFVARPKTFASLHSEKRPFVGARGGELLGIPAIPSRHVPEPVGGEILALIDPTGIVAGDTGIEVDITDQATIEMLDASLQQDGTTGAGAQQVSLWQSDLIGIRIDRRVNWNAVRPSVSYIQNLNLAEV